MLMIGLWELAPRAPLPYRPLLPMPLPSRHYLATLRPPSTSFFSLFTRARARGVLMKVKARHGAQRNDRRAQSAIRYRSGIRDEREA
jgi:hypothetical protein